MTSIMKQVSKYVATYGAAELLSSQICSGLNPARETVERRRLGTTVSEVFKFAAPGIVSIALSKQKLVTVAAQEFAYASVSVYGYLKLKNSLGASSQSQNIRNGAVIAGGAAAMENTMRNWKFVLEKQHVQPLKEGLARRNAPAYLVGFVAGTLVNSMKELIVSSKA